MFTSGVALKDNVAQLPNTSFVKKGGLQTLSWPYEI